MFETLEKVLSRPKPYEFYTAADLWTDEYVSKQMLKYHLDEEAAPASRPKAFIDKSAAWIISRFNIGAGSKVCDFGCGPGLYTTRFAGTGADVTGIDFSERSINHARKTAQEKNLDINYVNQNYLDYQPAGKFDLITLIYCDLCPLSPDQRKIMLAKFRDCLKDDGAVLLDVHTLSQFNALNEDSIYSYSPAGGFWAAGPYHEFQNTFKYEKEKVVLFKHTIFEKDRTRVIYNWLQHFSLESIKEEFRTNGLEITEYYSDVAGTPYNQDSTDMAVIARKV